MNDHDLVSVLRHTSHLHTPALAADRIEALTKERDEARARLGEVSRLLSTERLDHADTCRKRDAALSFRDAWMRSADACAAERNEAHSEVHRIRAALGCVQFEPTEDAARRVVRERDEARAAFARARNEASFQAAKSSALDSALRDIETERDALQLRYEALFAQSIHLAREVDRGNNEKADRVEAGASEKTPIGLGDRVSLVTRPERLAKVIGFFTSVDGVEFLAVEPVDGSPRFWRRDDLARVS